MANVAASVPHADFVYLIDDGSTAQVASELRSEVRRRFNGNVRCLLKDGNYGIADSVNGALKLALNDSVDALLFLDQDTQLTTTTVPDIMRSYIRCRSDFPEVVAIGPGVVGGASYGDRGTQQYVEQVELIQSGAVFSVQAMDEVGGADSSLFIDAVDTDLCLRLRSRGYRLLADFDIQLNHQVGNSGHKLIFGRRLITNHSAVRRYYMTRNRLVVIRRWWRQEPKWTLIYLRRFLVSGFVAVSFEQHRVKKLRAIYFGVVDGARDRLGKREDVHTAFAAARR